MVNNSIKNLFWISCIIAAELTSFWLLQESVDKPEKSGIYIFFSILLFGLVVPLAFRETLRGTQIAVANLYWIIASSIGSIILGYFAFNQHLSTKVYIAFGLLIAATAVAVFA